MKYKVVILDDEAGLEATLNKWAEQGWRFCSMESEYKTSIIIFERD